MEGLANFLSSLGVEYDGRNFSSFDWLENEETCNLLHEKAFEIIEAINRRKEESKNERIGDFRSTFALAIACSHFLGKGHWEIKMILAGEAHSSYVTNLVKTGEIDVFFDHQCRKAHLDTSLEMHYLMFRNFIAQEGMTGDAISDLFMNHIVQTSNMIQELMRSLELCGRQEHPMNFANDELQGKMAFDYYISLIQAVRGFMLQFSCVQPVIQVEHAQRFFEMAGPLITNAIELLAQFRDGATTSYIMFQTLMAQFGIFFAKYTDHEIPAASNFDQCNRATIAFDELEPIETYCTLFAHVLRLMLIRDHEGLQGHRAQAVQDALDALEASDRSRHYDVYSNIINQLINDEEVNFIILSDELSLTW